MNQDTDQMKDNETIHRLKNELRAIEEKFAQEFEEISNFIFMNPELSGMEFVSSAYLMDILKSHEFSVVGNYCDYETAFRAECVLGSGEGPVIALLAEYDALPVSDRTSEDWGQASNRIVPGHTCGHNWISAATVGTCVSLSKLTGVDGKIVVIGTPAEETVGSKVDMIRHGAFEDIDIVLMPHLEAFTDIACTALASDAIEFRFAGKATHAASYPYEGINALDAVQLMFSGVNAMRQQLKDDVKICGIVTSGGDVPNIIPDYASCRYSIRASERSHLNEVTQRVINCARGAELMTGARMTYSYFQNPTDDILNLPILQSVLKKNMIDEGIQNIRDDVVMPTGSSDIGNVSQVCPTMYFELDIESNRPFFTHSDIALDYVNSHFAYTKLHQAIRVMGNMAIEIFMDDALVPEAKRQHINMRSMQTV